MPAALDDLRQLLRDLESGRAIRCPFCRWVSYNRNDVAERFCGHCDEYHDVMFLRATLLATTGA